MSNKLIASVLTAVQQAIVHKRNEADGDPITMANTDWNDEARAILTGIPTSKKIDLAAYVTTVKGFTQDDLTSAGAAISLMEQTGPLLDALANNTPINDFTGNEQPDQEIVNHILSRLIDTSNKASNTAMKAATTVAANATPSLAPAIEPGMLGAINSLLSQATSGQIKDLGSILSQNQSLSSELQQTRQSLTEALSKASRPPVPTSGTTATAQGELTFEVVNKKAADIFIINGKKATQGLNFDIPTLVWKDKDGNVVAHPEVPAVDQNYDFDAVKVLLFLTALNRGMNTWLFGHTGTGKSTFVEQIAALIGWPVSRINLDSSLERADLVGHVTLAEENGTTVSKYEEGILPRAMQRPGFLLMDEIDAGRPDILFVVQRALENKGLMLTEDQGRIVQPHPLFRFAATANTRGQGDEYGMYAGTRTMNASMIDRFTAFIEFDYMEPKREAALLQKIVPALQAPIAEKMALFAKEIRVAFGKGEVYNTISPRGLGVLADCYCTFVGLGSNDAVSLQLAMDMSILNKVTNDTRQKFIELAQRVFGLTPKKK